MMATILFVLMQTPTITPVTGPLVNWVIGFLATMILAMGGFIVKMWGDRNKIEMEQTKVLEAIKIYMEQITAKLNK